ncbi:MAG TPA: phosphatidylserine/phosphatidylglycerophosphate/cardiolipin synthase family protein [Candidatus Dormibacteraeota bacterium]|nr:phosphatidylserine/phosphatidylglycerophosphate/cardiolipin synthase family protein [Candidatus Dormibacteraeota bacterium]
MHRLACFFAVLSLLGCSGPAPVGPASVSVLAGSGPGPGREEPVQLWSDASIFVLVRSLIGSAHHRVLVEMYELGRSDVVKALGAARARGVVVRVITDPTVAESRRSSVKLDRLGVPERVYPIDDRGHQIDHVKLLIADGEAVVGGMNWGAHSDRNHDYVLETRVQAEVDRLVRIFEQDWSLAAGRPAPLASAIGEVAQTAPGAEIRGMLSRALVRARLRVLAEVFTLTDPALIAELTVAHRRGVSVRVLLDPNQAYNRHGYAVLRAAGVQVRWFPIPKGALLHAKIGLFDGELVLGSANWTLSGLGVNHELDIETGDPRAVATFASRFEADWALAGG